MNKYALKVFLVCTGVGNINRGIETFARECFDGLHGTEGLQIKLFKGAGPNQPNEYRLWNLPRNGKLAPLVGKTIRRNGYVVEQLSAFLPFVAHIRRDRPDIIFYSDSNLGFQLYRWRKQIGVDYKLLFSNGGPCHPPFTRTDYVQQVAPYYQEIALQAGEPAYKHLQVPYGINVPDGPPLAEPQAKTQIRRNLTLPEDRPIVLSVGWISAYHKRMDYVINEIVGLPEPRPYLVLLGHVDDKSSNIIEIAYEKLGQANFTIRSVPYENVKDYYQAADLFTLASLNEGFGRVFLEALIHGLPCIVHDHPIMRFVLGNEGYFADLSKPGVLSQTILEILPGSHRTEDMIKRREYVRKNFSWSNLAPIYLQMFKNCLSQPI